MRFDEQVFALVAQIPKGRVSAYGDVGAAMGNPRLARQVGFALGRLPLELSDEVPWHRVINARGMISGRGELIRPELQRALLEEEGVVFDKRGRCDLSTCRFVEFSEVLAHEFS